MPLDDQQRAAFALECLRLAQAEIPDILRPGNAEGIVSRARAYFEFLATSSSPQSNSIEEEASFAKS
jgi:hypothetical protein